ncbi:MAG: restriction endonuclease [Candidatus Bathyarchaeia archaeon]
MLDASSAKEIKLKITLRDPRAIEIVESIPAEQRDQVIEKYIILGEMVLSHALIATREETIEEFFAPLKEDIETIRDQLKLIVPTMATPTKKGEITQESVFKSFQEHFMDDEFEDVSRIGKYADILATTSDTKTQVLIELKDYKGLVPYDEVDKFWRDMERRGTKYGIFVSMRSGIAKCSGCISLKTQMDKTAVFVVNSELNWQGHLFAYYIIKKLAELESVKKRELKGEELSKVIAKINGHISEINKNLEMIEQIQEIADYLKTTCNNRLNDLISLTNTYKNKLKEKIEEIFEEIRKIEI